MPIVLGAHQQVASGLVMQRFQEASAMSSSDAKLEVKKTVTSVTLEKKPQSAAQPNRPKAGNSKGGWQAPSPQVGPEATTWEEREGRSRRG